MKRVHASIHEHRSRILAFLWLLLLLIDCEKVSRGLDKDSVSPSKLKDTAELVGLPKFWGSKLSKLTNSPLPMRDMTDEGIGGRT